MVSEVTTLSESETHAAFAGFTHGVSASWNYFARVTNVSSLHSSSDPLLPLETVIYRNLIPQLTGLYDLSDTIRKLLSLPYWFGGLNITNPCTHLPSQHPFSCETCSPLIDYYFSDSTGSDISECLGRQHYIKSTVVSRYYDSLTATASDHMIHLHNIVLTYAPQKGASNWDSALPFIYTI